MNAPFDVASLEPVTDCESATAAPRHEFGRFGASSRLRARAHALIPGGAHTYAKGDDQYPILAPGFIARGQGCRVWDADGNEFIEYGMGNRAIGLGHAYPAVLEAVMRELPNGCNFTRPSLDAALEVYARALGDGVERDLVGRPSRTVFRRYA